jgi:hypothetical protein
VHRPQRGLAMIVTRSADPIVHDRPQRWVLKEGPE